MRVALALITVLATSSCWADDTATPSAAPAAPAPATTPDSKDADAVRAVENRFHADDSSSEASILDSMAPLNTFNLQKPPTEEDKEQEKKALEEKNWLVNAMREKESGGNADKYSQFHDAALKALAKTTDKNDPTKPDTTLDKIKSTDKSADAARTASDAPATPNDPAAAHTNTASSKPTDVATAGALNKFQPTISGLSSDATKPLSINAEKAYSDLVATITPIQPINTSSLPAPPLSIEPIVPINPSINSTAVGLPSIYTPLPPQTTAFTPLTNARIEPATPLPTLTPAPVHPIISPQPASPVTNIGAYKPKVADPADYLNQ